MLSSRAYLRTWAAGLVLFVVLLPLGGGLVSNSLLMALTAGAAYATAVVGMDLMTGYSGQPHLGQGAFMAIGAYVSTAMMTTYQWNFIAAVGFSVLVSVLVAVVLGAGALRLANIGLAIVTFSFAFVVFTLLNGDVFGKWTGKASGLIVPSASFLGLDFAEVTGAYYASLLLLAIAMVSTYIYAHSRHGRILMAIKRSEVLTSVLGVNVFNAKLAAMVWSSVIGSLAGVVLAQSTGNITPEAYTAMLSVTLLAIAAVGGLGTVVGPAIGAFVFAYVGFAGASVQGSGFWWPILFLFVLMFSPSGIYGVLTTATRRVRTLLGLKGSQNGTKPASTDDDIATPGEAPHADWNVSAEPTSPRPELVGPTVLRVDALDLRYGGVTALNQVGFEVTEGAIHALIGPNGAGKTSLLDVLTGVTLASAGEVELDGHSILGLGPHRRVHKGLRRSFQHAALVADLSVYQNVQLAAESDVNLRSGSGFGGRRKLVADRTVTALNLAGVSEEKWNLSADELNGGDQKLVDIARAFVGDPRLILLDEPTSGVTEAEIGAVAAAIQAAADQGITVLVIDHNVQFVKSIADHVTVLDFGLVIADGAPVDVLSRPGVVTAFLGGEKKDA